MYIRMFVIIIGLIVLINNQFTFKWSKVGVVAFLSSFSKVLSGGGFGPLVSTGMIVSGKYAKTSVVIIGAAEIPICFSSFITWLILGSFDFDWFFIFIPGISSSIRAFF